MKKIGWSLAIVGSGMMSLSAVRAEWRHGAGNKVVGIEFHPASPTPTSNFEKILLEAQGTTLYVAPSPLWSDGEVVSAQMGASLDGLSLELTLTREAAQRALSLKQDRSRVAIFVDGELTSVGSVNANGVRATIRGLTAPSAERLVKRLKGVRPAPSPSPVSSAMIVVAAGMEDELYLFDVFVQGAANVRSYQVALTSDGGTMGELVREDVRIDSERADFAFGEMAAISAADQVGGRLAGVLIDGGVDIVERAYLGTYAFRPTPDARGTFRVGIDTGGSSFLADAQNEMIEFSAGEDAFITIADVWTTRRLED